MGNKFLKPRSNEPTFTKSTGLYPRCEWDDKTVKKLINKKKIAPRYPGREDQASDLDECPICFLWYPGGLNRSNCCKQQICTECYLQFKKPAPAKPCQCPFCNAHNYAVKYTGCLTKEEREAMQQEEQKVIEAKIRMRKEELEREVAREKEVAEERERREREGPSAEEIAAQENARSDAALRGGDRSSHASGHGQQDGTSAGHLRLVSHQQAQPIALTGDDDAEDAEFHNDIEDLMVMEAIRLSLLDNRQSRSSRATAGHDVARQDDESLEAGAGQIPGEHRESRANSADGSIRTVEEEDWPAITWGEDEQDARQGTEGPAGGGVGAAAGGQERIGVASHGDGGGTTCFNLEVDRLLVELQEDTTVFELLMSGKEFFAQQPLITRVESSFVSEDGYHFSEGSGEGDLSREFHFSQTPSAETYLSQEGAVGGLAASLNDSRNSQDQPATSDSTSRRSGEHGGLALESPTTSRHSSTRQLPTKDGEQILGLRNVEGNSSASTNLMSTSLPSSGLQDFVRGQLTAGEDNLMADGQVDGESCTPTGAVDEPLVSEEKDGKSRIPTGVVDEPLVSEQPAKLPVSTDAKSSLFNDDNVSGIAQFDFSEKSGAETDGRGGKADCEIGDGKTAVKGASQEENADISLQPVEAIKEYSSTENDGEGDLFQT